MKKAPYPLIPAVANRVYAYIFSYAGDESDIAVDKAAFNTELEKHLLINQTPGIPNYGLRVTGSDLTISASTTKRTIALSLADTEIGTTVKHPYVFYKGSPIPFSDFETVAGGDGLLGLITLKANTTTTYPSTTATDYVVWYTDCVLGIVTNIDCGGISIPLDKTSFKAISHEEAVVNTSNYGDEDASGSITVLTSLTSIMFDGGTTPLNYAGEELEARVYGSNWSQNAGYAIRNEIAANVNPFGICLLYDSGKELAGGGQGEVFAKLMFIYHCKVTGWPNPTNIQNDATDPVLQTVEFAPHYPNPEYTSILCTS